MAATVVAKITTTRLLSYMQNKTALERKKAKVEKKITQFRNEMKTLRQEQVHRQELRHAARSNLGFTTSDEAGQSADNSLTVIFRKIILAEPITKIGDETWTISELG